MNAKFTQRGEEFLRVVSVCMNLITNEWNSCPESPSRTVLCLGQCWICMEDAPIKWIFTGSGQTYLSLTVFFHISSTFCYWDSVFLNMIMTFLDTDKTLIVGFFVCFFPQVPLITNPNNLTTGPGVTFTVLPFFLYGVFKSCFSLTFHWGPLSQLNSLLIDLRQNLYVITATGA